MADILKEKGMTLLDGAMGTVLQQKGLPPGGQPELFGLTEPELLKEVHRSYISSGSQVIYANTFGANRLKLAPTGHTAQEVISASVAVAKEAAAGTEVKVALDIGPLGKLLEPLGPLPFEEAYEIFREMAEAGAAAGADLAVIETMTDLYETKAALLAVKENTDLPVLVTMSFEESGRTFMGCTIPSMARTIEGLGADAVGLNCSLGPDKLVPLLGELCRNTRLPVIAKPNAGLPDASGRYAMGAEEFVTAILPCAELGVSVFGGCCGTGPEYISLLAQALREKRPAARQYDGKAFLCTPSVPLTVTPELTVGRIDPAEDEELAEALRDGDAEAVLDLAFDRQDDGADLLWVKVGCPGVDEQALLPLAVKTLQGPVSLPLVLESSDPAAVDAALRIYNGKPGVSLAGCGREEAEKILGLAKKYGAAVIGADRDLALSLGVPAEDVWDL